MKMTYAHYENSFPIRSLCDKYTNIEHDPLKFLTHLL